MASEIRWWWRRIKCWLTGGHAYADINLQTEHFPELCVTCFRNKCLKCGKWNVFAVDDEALYHTYPMPNRLEIDFDYEAED